MDPLSTNPFAILTFIAAPAILINASSVLTLGTSNRFARAVDRARSLAAEIEKRRVPGKEDDQDAEGRLRARQLAFAERRALYLVRALTAFYLSVGAFAAASFASLLGAIFTVAGLDVYRNVALGIALPAGAAGVGGLVSGSGLLVWETRMALRILLEETDFLRQRIHGS